MKSFFLSKWDKSFLGVIIFPLFTIGLLLLLFLAYRPSQAAWGGVINVNSAADTDDGSCNAANCTLREAILAANSTEGPETITFSLPPNGTITLAGNQLPPVEGQLTIDGSTAVNLTISGSDASRVLVVGPNPIHYPPPPTPTPYPVSNGGGNERGSPAGNLGSGTAVTLTNLTITKGYEPYNKGGGIYNSETLVIQNSTISNHNSKYGAIYNEGSLTIVDSTIINNEVTTGAGDGAGLYNADDSTLTIIGTTIRFNIVSSTSSGGGLYNDGGHVSIADSIFDTNAGASGSAIYHRRPGTLTVADSIFKGNQLSRALLVGGTINMTNSLFSGNTNGALDISNTANIDNTVFSGNSAASIGGAIVIRSSTNVIVTNSVFNGNVTGSGGGAISSSGHLSLVDSTFSNNSSAASGGAILQGFGTMTIDGSTFNGNTAVNGGAIQIQNGAATVLNSTISGNSAQNNGGGIHADGTLIMNNNTLNGNEANSGGGIFNAQSMHVTNSILANSLSGGDCVNSGMIIININNLVENGSCGPAFSGDPLLGPLQDNGGPTLTHYPQSGSLAVDNGYNPACEPADQRGLPRPLDGNEDGTTGCDIGAVERGKVFVVNSANDVTTGICNQSHCSLREAIQTANANIGTDIIRFNIPGSGPRTIKPLSPLPAITSPVIMDGFTQPGAVPNTAIGQPGGNAILQIELDGSAAGPLASGLTLNDFNSLVRGLAINGFSGDGLRIIGSGATGNVVAGNFIGPDVNGLRGLGNGGANVFIGSGASGNTIGGEGVADGNIIAFAGMSGVVVATDDADGNEIRSNAIYSNGLLGIDLGNDGLTVNDLGDGDSGPNSLQNYPELLAATADLGNTIITGTLDSTPLTAFTLEFFANTTCDGSGNGEGQRLLGLVEVSTDNGGGINFDVSMPIEVGTNEFVSATATDPAGNSSEFSGCVSVIDAPISGLTATNSSPTPLGLLTFFEANLTSGGNVSYSWNFGDGTGGSGQLVSHIYPAEGVFTAVITASNSINMLTATTMISITEELPTSVYATDFGMREPFTSQTVWLVGFAIGAVGFGIWFYGRRRQ